MLEISGMSSDAVKEWIKVTCDVMNEDIENVSALNHGDTIGVKGSGSSGLLDYHHLGIYLGYKEVIDYTNDSQVRRISLITFTENNSRPLCRINYINSPTANTPDVVLENAIRKFRYQDFGRYNLISNNCEHFVTYCTFGKRFSFQVAKTVQAVTSSCVTM